MSQPEAQNDGRATPGDRPSLAGKPIEPGWASGLRRLYNSVVEEPLPDSFDDLLKKLDKGRER